jgi:two-component system sensor histidine kinase UhpB
MSKVFKILHVEDSCDDADLVQLALQRDHFACEIRCVDTESAFSEALAASQPDVVLCDWDLPSFSAERAFAILRERGLDLPFIVVSHHVGRGGAMMDMGADGYVPKRELVQLSDLIGAVLARRQGPVSAPG